MRWTLLAAISASPVVLSVLAGFGAASAQDSTRITGPVTHQNLSVYFIRGTSAAGPVPLTLEEALAKRVVEVRETGNVNQLEVENLGGDEVFIQSGDIVKGGQQDRTLMVSLVLPPKSGRISIDAFCVEQGRWSARGKEDVKQFASASSYVPSREMKLAMKAPRPAPSPGPAALVPGHAAARAYAPETSTRQSEVWAGVAKMQALLSDSVGSRVNSQQSASSLQLAMENEKLADVRRGYINALKTAGDADDDIVGYVFAVNGKLNSADVYPSNGLFRKMWTKLLDASATEAIGHKDEKREAAPTIETVMAFLADAERGRTSERPLNNGAKLESRDGDNAYYFETARADGWIHRNYLAK